LTEFRRHDIVRQGRRDVLVPPATFSSSVTLDRRDAARVIPELGIDAMVLNLRLQDGTGDRCLPSSASRGPRRFVAFETAVPI
jgi:hypothetical protein